MAAFVMLNLRGRGGKGGGAFSEVLYGGAPI